MKSKVALGKGFEGLIPTNFDVAAVVEPGEHIKQLSLDKIVVNPQQPRKEFDHSSLQELADSIRQYGIIQPLVVTPADGGMYRIVAGERRFRASQLAGLKKVPVLVRNHRALEELEIALVENVQRVDLSPLEQAVSIVRLRDQFSLSPREIAKKLGKAETTISNIIRLLQLPKAAVEAMQKNVITEGHARAILALKNDSKLQEKLLAEIVKGKWSVRQAEAFVQEQKSHIEHKNSSINPEIEKQIRDIHNRGYDVKITHRKDGGTLKLNYANASELERILKLFS